MKARKGRVLITDMVDHALVDGLAKAGYDVDYNKDITQRDVEAVVHLYHGIVITTKISLPGPVVHQAVNLKWIARAGSGLDHVDVHAAAQRNIACFTSPEGNAGSVGEHCVMMLLAMLRRLAGADNDVKQYRWDTDAFRVTELSGMTVGIIGYGNTGPAFAKRLQGFEVNVIAYDKYRLQFDDKYAGRVSFDELQEQADVLSVHLPLTRETRGMLDERFVAGFRKNFFLINTSRGNLLPSRVLADALDSGKIAGAAVDVLDNESFETHTHGEIDVCKRLFAHPKLLVTPHIAGKSSTTRRRHAAVLLAKVLAHSGL